MKGVKRVKNTSSLSEQVEGQDSVDNFRLSAGVSDLNVKQLNPTLETGLDQERKKTEAIVLFMPVSWGGGCHEQQLRFLIIYMYYVQAEKLDIEMKEMLALGEKVAGLKEKLATVPEDKKERAKETLGIFF